MTPSSRSPTTSSVLPDRLHRQLNSYALAASAAGVSLLALVQPSEAKIVYTKTHKVIETNGVYPLDLNHDGNIDFLIQEKGYPSSSGYNGLAAKEAFGNAVKGGNFLAAAMKKGAPIGPGQGFISTTGSVGEVMFSRFCTVESGCSVRGKWANVTNRYLGLRFLINGKTHYGWARLNVAVQQYDTITATLTGYAYETTAEKEILAGQTQGADGALTRSGENTSESATREVAQAFRTRPPASLGRLARGAQYMPLRRRP